MRLKVIMTIEIEPGINFTAEDMIRSAKEIIPLQPIKIKLIKATVVTTAKADND